MNVEAQKGLPVSKVKTHPDWIVTGTKIVLYFALILFLLNQIKTTEIFFDPVKQEVNIFNPDFSVIWQIPGMFFGWNSIPNYAVLAGWIIEALYWAALMKMKPMLARAKSIHEVHERVLLGVLVIVVALNLVTDYLYGPSFFAGNDIIGHTAYSLLAEAVLIYGPIAIEALSS